MHNKAAARLQNTKHQYISNVVLLSCLLLPRVIRHLLFIYFQVNTGVLYFLDCVEDIYIMVLSVLVLILNQNHMYLFDEVLQCFCFRCFSGVSTWRLM